MDTTEKRITETRKAVSYNKNSQIRLWLQTNSESNLLHIPQELNANFYLYT